MRRVFLLALFAVVLAFSLLSLATAKPIQGGPLKEADWLKQPVGDKVDEARPKAPWITKWYAPDGPYENNGGFAASAPKDLIDEGTKGKLDQIKLSTAEGLMMTENIDLDWAKKNGGPRGWTVVEIDPADNHNMNTMYGQPPTDNFDTYAMIVIESPKDMKAVMSSTHDDHAQIWINGEKWYNNSLWTGAALEVDYEVEVNLKKGGNVLVFRCGESGGDAYFNLHFDDDTNKAVKYFPDKADDKASFLTEAAAALSVSPAGKLPEIWGRIKRGQ